MNLQPELCAVVHSYGSFRALDKAESIAKSTLADIARHPHRCIKRPRLFNTVWLMRKLYIEKFGEPWPKPIRALLEHLVESETRYAIGVINAQEYRDRLQKGFKDLETIWPDDASNPELEAGCIYVHATYLYDFATHFCTSLPLVKSERVRMLIGQYTRVRDILRQHAPKNFERTIDKATINILATEMMSKEPTWALSHEAEHRIQELGALDAAKRLALLEPMNLDLMNNGLQVASSAKSTEDCKYFWAKLTQELHYGVNPWREPKYAPKQLEGITGPRMAFFYNEIYLKDLVPHFV